MSYTAERAVAVDAVTRASKLGRAVQSRLIEGASLQKGDRSPVTVADFGAQAVISHLLGEAFPGIPLIGEEDAEALRQPGNTTLKQHVLDAVESVLPGLSEAEVLDAIDRGTYAGGATGQHWCLDPVDGTKGFLRLDQYAVALALIEDGQPVLGVLGCPNLPHDALQAHATHGCLFVAAQGEGAVMRTVDGTEESLIRVSDVRDPSQARLCESVEKGHTSQSESAQVAERLGIEQAPYRIDSQCKYAAVARGDASIYLRLPTRPGYVEKVWDHAAGWMVCTEAGGRVSDVRGEPLDFSRGRRLEANKGVVVTNGPIHDRVVAEVRAVLGL